MVRFETIGRAVVIASCWLFLPTIVLPVAVSQTADDRRVQVSDEIGVPPMGQLITQESTANQASRTPGLEAERSRNASVRKLPLPEAANDDSDDDPPRPRWTEPTQLQLSTSHLFEHSDRYPIDLASAMQLAGANNVQIALAIERVCEARARLNGARAMWLPSLNVGAGFNHHDGTIQDTAGQVLDLSRGSTFVGGGASVGSFPLAGGSNGPARLAVDLSLTDALFEPLAARQDVRAAEMDRHSKHNDVLFEVAVAYLELSRAQSILAISFESVEKAQELLRLTEAQETADVGLPADVARSQDELGLRQRQVLMANERIGVASAELSRLLRLDPALMLVAQDERPLPLDFVDPSLSLSDLITQGQVQRPEHGAAVANVQAARERKRQEELRPWIPNLHAGYSAGGFAGGSGSFIGDYGSRGDFDVLAVWQVRNLGAGNRALRDGAASRFRQAHLAEAGVRDQIAAEVSAYYHRVCSRREQIEISQRRVEATSKALPLNFRGIVGRQLRAIEAQQAIAGLNAARIDYLDSIIQFNVAQLGLLRAIGGPPNIICVDDPICP